MNVSKKQFLSNVNEWCWEGNGRYDLKHEYGAFIPEQVCATYTKWLEEWVVRFNTMENGFKVKLLIEGHYYRIRRIIVDDIKFPDWDNIEEEQHTVKKWKAGDISVESCVDEDESEEEESDDESDDEDEEEEEESTSALCEICWTKVELTDCYNKGLHTKEVDKTICLKCYAK
jgi:hypothetical protein